MAEGTAIEWHGSVPADVQGHAALSSFKNDAGGLGNLAKSYVEAHTKLSQPVLDRLDVKDPGTREKLFGKLGRPEKPDGYGLSDAGFAEQAHKAGLSIEQAKALAEHVSGQGAAAESKRAETHKAAVAKLASDTEATLKAEWGDKFQVEDGFRKKGLENDKFFPKALRDKLEASGLIHDPDLARLANKLGHAAQEGGLMSGTGTGGAGGDGIQDLRAARIEIEQKMIAMRKEPGHDPVGAGYRELVRKRQEILNRESAAKVAKEQAGAA